MSKDIYSLSFTEEMRGYWAHTAKEIKQDQFDEELFRKHYRTGESEERTLSFRLEIEVTDMDSFQKDSTLEAKASGLVTCPELGGELTVLDGTFNMFTTPTSSTKREARKEMHYWLPLRNSAGDQFTFYGYKVIEREDATDMWNETTTLYTYLWKGHKTDKNSEGLLGIGILRLNMDDFAKQMKTLSVKGGNWVGRTSALIQFLSIFAENLWEAYAPFFFGTDRSRWNDHPFPVQTTQGVKGCEITTHPVDTEDGLTIQFQRFKKSESKAENKDVVLLLHGLTTSTDMFIMPEHLNLVQYLTDNGLEDVWSLDWRGSGRLIYNLQPHRYTVDDVAGYDIPAALEFMRSHLPEGTRIHVICHCVGSIAFMSAVAAGWAKDITSICSNSVSFTPKAGTLAKIKLFFAPGIIEYLFGYPYISPKMPYFPGPRFGKWIFWMERLIRRECKEPACHMVSFMWGWGFPAAYLHKNLSPVTHRRLYDLFGGTAVHFYRHLRQMVFAEEGLAYKPEKHALDLPKSYLQALKGSQLPPTLFFSGDKNLIFPGSNKLTEEKVKEILPDAPVSYLEIPEYGHQDVFMGKKSATDVFPHLLDFINQHRK